MENTRNDFLSILSLFTSISTLLCCALPTLLVVLGLGAVLAGIVSDFPLLIALSKNKSWIFLASAILMGINFYLIYGRKRENENCTACDVASRWSKIILWISVSLWIISFFVAYLLLPLIKLWE